MKKLFLLLFAVVLVACKSPEQTALVAVGSAGSTANAAIGAYSEYIQAHQVPTEQIAEVRKAVSAYLAANEVARSAIGAYKAGSGTKATADIALDALSAASGNLITLVNTITQK